jgi:hypothetical protein
MLVENFDQRLLSRLLRVFESESRLLDVLAASALQSIAYLGQLNAWLAPSEPLIIQSGRLRIGVFNWTTDRDAFIAGLIGHPVPMSPRYAKAGPVIPVELTGELWDVQEDAGFGAGDASELYGMGREDAIAAARHLLPVLRRMGRDESGIAAILEALLSVEPMAFASSPLGRVLLPLARGAPGWRRPPVVTEWAGTFDLGLVGVLGIALWAPGPYELRRHRRAMAAYLRYLMDFHAAPWNRWSSPRTRLEAMALYWRRIPRTMGDPVPTIRQVAEALRGKDPGSYGPEAPEVTLRRLYRLSTAIRRG